MSDMDWIAIGNISTFGLLIVASVALLYAKGQLEQSQKIAKESENAAQGDFLLRLDATLQQHLETHLHLRNGDWDKGVPSDKWVAVESYMGLFETIQILIEKGIVDLDLIDDRYGYRVLNINHNPDIHEQKLTGATARYWDRFIKLRDAIFLRHPDWRSGL